MGPPNFSTTYEEFSQCLLGYCGGICGDPALLSCAGAALGVIFGLAVPPIVSQLSGTTAIVKPWAPAVAFMVAVLVGVAFGVYPARRAALMDPIEALRSE